MDALGALILLHHFVDWFLWVKYLFLSPLAHIFRLCFSIDVFCISNGATLCPDGEKAAIQAYIMFTMFKCLLLIIHNCICVQMEAAIHYCMGLLVGNHIAHACDCYWSSYLSRSHQYTAWQTINRPASSTPDWGTILGRISLACYFS